MRASTGIQNTFFSLTQNGSIVEECLFPTLSAETKHTGLKVRV